MHLTSASLRTQLITLVCLVTLIPFAAGQWLSYRQTAAVIRENMDEQTRLNLQQMEKTLDATLASYEDLLYQIYTNDTVVELVNKLATGEDVALSRNQLRREIQEKVFAKPYLGAITVLFEDGSYSTYDKLLASSTSSTWLDGWDSAAMYSQVASTNTTHYFPSAYAITLMDQPHYLFHIAHRVIDWRHVENRNAIIILSVEETLLSDICNEEWRGGEAGSAYFLLTDADDHIVSGPLAEMVGLPREEAPSLLEGGTLREEAVLHQRTGWTLRSIQDQSVLYMQLGSQVRFMISVLLVSGAVLIAAIVMTVRLLTRSVDTVAAAMQRAARGDLDVRISQSARMPKETAIIAGRFNAMMDDINALMREVREASEQQRNAEIAMLEAQINPHFLYNTLDTINWMAVDQNAFDVSNAIVSLARILRYGIEGSNRVVTVHEEIAWLRQYISLQQIRLKNSLDVHIDAPPELMDLPIHKLLFQPFVENAILHGFEGVRHTHRLEISLAAENGELQVTICDDGRGMTAAQCAALESGGEAEGGKHHIGVKNALQRMRMYYGRQVHIKVESALDEGTRIILRLPVGKEEQA